MIQDIKHLIENPEDVPNVPPAVKKYLQAAFSAEYLTESGQLSLIRGHGYSEQASLGFILGVQYASRMLDEMEARVSLQED